MDGEAPSILETGRGDTVLYRGRFLYSRHDPARIPVSSACGLKIREKTLVVVFSPVLGYGLGELLSSLPPGSLALCIEADQALMALSLERIRGETLKSEKIKFIRTDNPEAAAAFARTMGRFRKAVELRLSGGYCLNESTYLSILDAIDRDIGSYWMNKATLSAMGFLWAKNIFSNLKTASMVPPLPAPKTGKAVCVLGAGPSAESALPWIAQNRERLYLIAVDTALPFLAASRLKPDLAVCLDAQAYNLKDFIGSSRSGIALVADLCSHPKSFRGLGGGVYPVISQFTESAFLARISRCGIPMTEIPPLGSVGVVAAWLARRIGEGPIFLSGLDFSYERGKPHARGAPSSISALLSWKKTSSPLLYAASLRKLVGLEEDIVGRTVATDPVLRNYARLFKKDIAPGASYFDLRGGGLDLGVERAGFAEADSLLSEWAEKQGRKMEAVRMKGEGSADARSSQSARSLLAEESGRLSEIYAILKGGGDENRLAPLLFESDYLYWKFPDAPEFPTAEQSFLNRILVETLYWKEKIGILLGESDSGSSPPG